jgi:hypothetical protein
MFLLLLLRLFGWVRRHLTDVSAGTTPRINQKIINYFNIYDLLIHHVYPRKRCFSDTNLGKYAKFRSLEGTLPYLFFFWYAHKTTGAINTPHGNTTHHYHLQILLQQTPPIRRQRREAQRRQGRRRLQRLRRRRRLQR